MLDLLDKAMALRRSRLCSTVDADALLPIAERARSTTLAEGAALFSRGDAGDAAFVIVSGRVRVDRDAGTVEELGAGEVVGEMAAIDGGARTATVTALVETSLLRFERDHFLDVLVDHPSAARALAAVLAGRLRGVRP